MRLWIEVARGDSAWINKQISDSHKRQGLVAPIKKLSLMKSVKSGDVVLTHLTQSLTKNKDWRSAIVGISMVDGTLCLSETGAQIPLSNIIELPRPIKFSDYKNIKTFSKQFQWRIKICLHNYLIEITAKDFLILLGLHPENLDALKDTAYSKMIKDIRLDGDLIK